MSELIHMERTNWKEEVIRQLFLPIDAKTILGILLSIRLPGDRMIWAETNNGCFIVRNAYKVAINLHRTVPHIGFFGGNYGDFLSLTRFAISLGGSIIIFFLPKIICFNIKCSRIAYMTSVVRLPNPLVTCFGHVLELSWC